MQATTLKINNNIRLYLIPLALLSLFFLLSFSDRVLANDTLKITFFTISGALLFLYIGMLIIIRIRKSATEIILVILKPHYVQMLMHLCIFIYWGWYWPQVYAQTVLILAQLVFVHIVDFIVPMVSRRAMDTGFWQIPHYI